MIDLASPWLWVWLELVLFALLLVSAPTTLHRDFCALMNLKRVRDAGGLSPVLRVMATYLLARGYLIDAIVNLVHLSVLMREWPRELTVTSRVSRLKVSGNARQREIAEWFCGPRGLQLDALDPSGCHCKE